MENLPDIRPRRRRLTTVELCFPPSIVAAVRADEAVREAQLDCRPVTLVGGCQLYQISPCRPTNTDLMISTKDPVLLTPETPVRVRRRWDDCGIGTVPFGKLSDFR